MTPSPHITLIDRALPVILLGGVILVAFLTLLPFLPAILWGVILAVAIDPLYRRLAARMNGRKLVALWCFGIILLLFLLCQALGWHGRCWPSFQMRFPGWSA